MRGYLASDILEDDEGWHYVKLVTDDPDKWFHKIETIYYLDHPDEHNNNGCECVWRNMGMIAWFYQNPDCPVIHIDQEVERLLHKLLDAYNREGIKSFLKIGH